MSEPFLGEIRIFTFGFAPKGWALCNGQLLQIAENDALFSLIGTVYGGDGVTTFALPDLRGRVNLGLGQGPGLSLYSLGQKGGAESVALTANQVGAHTHNIAAASSATAADPGSTVIPGTPAANTAFYASAGADTALAPSAIGSAGSGGAHENRQPFTVINYIIALNGIFPTPN